MSNPIPSRSAVSGNVVIVSVVVVFCFVVACIVGLVIFAPDGTDVGAIVTALLGSLAATITALVTLIKVNEVGKQVEYLANGGTDAKNRAALADVLDPSVIKQDPETQEQLERDRAYRAAGPNGAGTP